MKKLALATIVCGLVMGTSIQTASANQVAEGICTAISADDRQRLRTILSNHNMRLRNIYSGVRCNGYSMLQFAITAEAAQVGEMITRQLPASAIEEDTVNGETMLNWAESSGYGSSAVVDAVRSRLGE
ncbi:hypothetical protein CWE12_13375 [Aliidiomarina sedimenti]|uniref:DUF3718 domain-containing protein n=2 Tax=Aliidiomarina TaxID=1249554 RepID=A0A432WDU3_9GAMM|nr:MULTISPECIES: DUF3718 domain-containing protein [Aliidiomarina]RUO27919.1 hypothetical protein CWE12_13375 [Aliidiomarina sedimenti]RUO31036.1 hypothetical protein CWE14_11055 [Aliidiomarina soli]